MTRKQKSFVTGILQLLIKFESQALFEKSFDFCRESEFYSYTLSLIECYYYTFSLQFWRKTSIFIRSEVGKILETNCKFCFCFVECRFVRFSLNFSSHLQREG